MGFIVIVLWNFSFYSRLLLRHSWVSPGKKILYLKHIHLETKYKHIGKDMAFMFYWWTAILLLESVLKCVLINQKILEGIFSIPNIFHWVRYFFPHALLPFTLVSTSQLIRGTIFFLSVISKAEAHCIVRDQNQNLLQLLRKSVIVF